LADVESLEEPNNLRIFVTPLDPEADVSDQIIEPEIIELERLRKIQEKLKAQMPPSEESYGSTELKCSICEIHLKCKSALLAHERSHNRDAYYGKFAAPGQTRRKSKAIEPNRTTYECRVCSQSFKMRAAWISHERSHDPSGTHQRKKYKRKKKKNEGSSEDEVQEENSKEKIPKRSNFECSICGVILKNYIGLFTHERSHARDDEFGMAAAPGTRRRKKTPRTPKTPPEKWDQIHQCTFCGRTVEKYLILFGLK
jgi:hypothetical protein